MTVFLIIAILLVLYVFFCTMNIIISEHLKVDAKKYEIYLPFWHILFCISYTVLIIIDKISSLKNKRK